jgi:protoheme ferro-lyase
MRQWLNFCTKWARTRHTSVWSDYKAWHQGNENVLYIDSNRSIVQQVSWQGDTLVISFHGLPMRYYAAPLLPLEEHEKW